MRKRLSACASLLLVAGADVFASETEIQLFEVSCREFLLSESDEVDLINVFHLGYLAGSAKQKSIDIEVMRDLSMQVKMQCIETPDAPLVETFQKVSKRAGDR